MHGFYKLNDDGTVEPCSSMEWAKWLEAGDKRTIGRTFTKNYMISTVFLGMDHGWGISEEPVLFETMVFPYTEDGDVDWCDTQMYRYHTKTEALFGHQQAVELCEKREGTFNRMLDTAALKDEKNDL